MWSLRRNVAWLSPELQAAYRYPSTVRACIASGFESSIGQTRASTPAENARVDELLAELELVPLAERQRRVGERRMAQAVNSVGGPVSGFVLVVLVGGLVVVLGCAVLIAGRTRRVVAHPALLAATLVMAGTLALVAMSIASQARELRQAATGDLDAYVAANDASSRLSQLRVTEISAVAARGSGQELYDRFAADATALTTQLTEAPGNPGGIADLSAALDVYTSAAEEVRLRDEQGDNRGAADLALPALPDAAGSADAFQDANRIATENVEREAAELQRRFDAAADADIQPLLPITLAGLAAVLAAAGILARGRRYR